MTSIEIETPHGRAVAHLHPASDPVGALVLGHGAGGGVGAPDLIAAAGAAVSLGVSVALVEQPYRVAGRRSPAPAHQLDTAWIAVVEALLGGGSRACRAWQRRPLVGRARRLPHRRCDGRRRRPVPGVPDAAAAAPGQAARTRSRVELDAVCVPVLIVQGEGDPFGMPPAAPGREVVGVRGNHSLRSDIKTLTAAVEAWLPRVLAPAG